MHVQPATDRSRQTMSPSIAQRVRLSRRQRALVGQWQTLGYRVVFVGLFAGMLMASNAPALQVVVVSLVVSAALLAPLGLMAVSARMRRYWLASVLGMLGVLLDAALVVLMLYGPWDGYPPLVQLMRVATAYVAAGVLAGAAVASFGVVRALWGAGDGPSQLGQSTPTSEAFVADGREATELGEGAPRQLRTMRLVPATC